MQEHWVTLLIFSIDQINSLIIRSYLQCTVSEFLSVGFSHFSFRIIFITIRSFCSWTLNKLCHRLFRSRDLSHVRWSALSYTFVYVFQRLVWTTTTRLNISKSRFVSIRVVMIDAWVKHIFYFMYCWSNGIREFLISGTSLVFLQFTSTREQTIHRNKTLIMIEFNVFILSWTI